MMIENRVKIRFILNILMIMNVTDCYSYGNHDLPGYINKSRKHDQHINETNKNKIMNKFYYPDKNRMRTPFHENFTHSSFVVSQNQVHSLRAFKFVGTLKNNVSQLALIQSENGEVFLIKEGDYIKNQKIIMV